MPVVLEWKDVALRLALTFIAGLAIGFNRGEHGRPAGMRTTLLVCLAASISMIQANLLMDSVGKTHDSFIVLDLMRLPLGVLSGMGFIGAGAIMRKDNMVLGVTTAATLWFTTMMGLCFGGGNFGLGGAALVLGLITLWGLKHAEERMKQDVRAALTLTITSPDLTDNQLRTRIADDNCRVVSWGVSYLNHGKIRKLSAEIERRLLPDETEPPAFVFAFAQNDQISDIAWRPQGLSTESASHQQEPKGTPIPISEPK